MPFLAFSKVKINFAKWELNWRMYSLDEALLTTKQVQMIDYRKFAAAALNSNKDVFIVHVAYLGAKMSIHPARKAQIALLLAKKVSVPEKYADFSDVVFKESAAVLPKCSDMNKHVIDLEPGKQLAYGPIYSLGPIELETLNTYIEINLTNGFIQSSKSPTEAFIFFVRKPDRSLCLCMDYRGLNNLTIKN